MAVTPVRGPWPTCVFAVLVAATSCGGLDEFGTPPPPTSATAGTGSSSSTTGQNTSSTSTSGAAGSGTGSAGSGGSSGAAGAGGKGGSGGAGGAGGSGGTGGAGGAGDAGDAGGAKADAGRDSSVSGGPEAGTGDAGGTTFASVKTILAANCAVTGCHGNNGGTMHIDLRDTAGLYTRLTSMPPATAPAACRTRTVVVPSMPTMSLIVAMVDTDNAARMNCGARMPDGCPNNRACLTTAQITTIKSWITAGAPQ